MYGGFKINPKIITTYYYATTLELAKHGTVILVGRNPDKLSQLQKNIELAGHKALTVVCDISDIKSIRNATEQIMQVKLPIAGLPNDAESCLQNPAKMHKAGV